MNTLRITQRTHTHNLELNIFNVRNNYLHFVTDRPKGQHSLHLSEESNNSIIDEEKKERYHIPPILTSCREQSRVID